MEESTKNARIPAAISAKPIGPKHGSGMPREASGEKHEVVAGADGLD